MIKYIKKRLYEWLKKDFETPIDLPLWLNREELDFHKLQSRVYLVPRDSIVSDDYFVKQCKKNFLEEVSKHIYIQSQEGYRGREVCLSLYIGKKRYSTETRKE